VVRAAHQNLAIRRDLHVDTGYRLADGSFPRFEGVIQRDDGSGFRQAVSLNHDESQLAPERLELRVERRRADDKRPELETEQPMNAAIEPPPERDVRPARLKRSGRIIQSTDVLAQHVENLGHRYEHRHTPPL